MPKAPLNGLPLAVPPQWAVSTLMLHFEGEDFTDDERPFAATAMVQARLDVPAGTAPGDVMVKDLSQVKRELSGFDLIGQGSTKVGAHDVRFLEFAYNESAGRRLRQLTFYCPTAARMFAVTGTHVEGERFDKVRANIVSLAQSVLEGAYVKLDLGPYTLDLQQGVYLPSLMVAAGEEDKGDALALGPTVKKAAVPAFRRTLSVSSLPLKTDKTDVEMIDEEIAKFVKSSGAKVVGITERPFSGSKAKLVEAKIQGPNNTPLVILGCVSFGMGFLFTVILTVLDGKNLGAARADFTKLLDGVTPGSLNK